MNRQNITNNSSTTESNLALILDSIPDLCFLFNFEGIILNQRSGLSKDLYLPREKFLGKNIKDVLPAKVSKAFQDALNSILREKTKLLTLEYSLSMPNGIQYFEAKLTPFQHDQVLALVRNITDRKLLEKELWNYREHLEEMVSTSTMELQKTNEKLQHEMAQRKKLEKEFIRLDRLNLVGEIAAALGHEIRNPMTSIKGFLQLLRAKHNGNAEYFDIIFEELDSINKILSEFLLLAKNKAVDLKSENINNIIKSIIPLLNANAALNNQYLHIELNDLPDIMLDQNQIRRLIINITKNGYEAMSDGGHLYLKTCVTGTWVNLVIRDEGPGIAPQILDKIGTPFVTTKEKGTGLGLAICYRIATRHNATLKVDSTASGTTFTIQFPVETNNIMIAKE